ncbi:uncharacterized protein MONOS_14905 [Monocercomonoides exilis]|uniref:uncharacterized protein n=1 Tax=Monocercomonoides exilis TaxID=2049356 RepID=UPI00355A7EB3|nr:hypothetical protein MONOS_14905 [Monocercomonoides exilis]|eukprot:MONOS_14905.1-p1 / transcript=MONOS_14905.1 / gene=MONOS_14905 / organism=Monocercomonoides_exilis_PA203 / gene_product=unspecified product / transcript_product=unspecified product / location=Mono_scaffold01103:1172-2194(-) / protein_length=341 / sequence_SO=supercontig / SO=protein_coding / is_pseudo=false
MLPFVSCTFMSQDEFVIESSKFQLESAVSDQGLSIYVQAVLKLREDTFDNLSQKGTCVVRTESIPLRDGNHSYQSNDNAKASAAPFHWWIIVVVVVGVLLFVTIIVAIAIHQRRHSKDRLANVSGTKEDKVKKSKGKISKDEEMLAMNHLKETSKEDVLTIVVQPILVSMDKVNRFNDQMHSTSLANSDILSGNFDETRSYTRNDTPENVPNSSPSELIAKENDASNNQFENVQFNFHTSFEQLDPAVSDYLCNTFVDDVMKQLFSASSLGDYIQSDNLLMNSAGNLTETNIISQCFNSQLDNASTLGVENGTTTSQKKVKKKRKKGKKSQRKNSIQSKS